MRYLQKASYQVMFCILFLIAMCLQCRITYAAPRSARLRADAQVVKPLTRRSAQFLHPLHPPPQTTTSMFTMINFLMWRRWWLRWVASAVVRVTTDLRHTDSRGLLHDQSSGRRHLGNPLSSGMSAHGSISPWEMPLSIYITGVDKVLRERRDASQSLRWMCSIRPPFANG